MFVLFVVLIGVFFLVFRPIKARVGIFIIFCFLVSVFSVWLIFGGEVFSWILLVKFLALNSCILAVLYRLRWSDIALLDFFSIKSSLGGIGFKGGCRQRVIMDSLFYFFILMCLVLVVLERM